MRTALLLLATIVMLAAASGCLPGAKALDSTLAVQAIAEMGKPGEVGGSFADPAKGGALAIPPVSALKDVQVAYEKDAAGNVKATLKTTSTPALDMLFGHIAGIDATKFAEDQRWRDWLDSQRDFYTALIEKYAAPGGLGGPAPPAADDTGIKDLVRLIVLEKLEELRQQGKPTP